MIFIVVKFTIRPDRSSAWPEMAELRPVSH